MILLLLLAACAPDPEPCVDGAGEGCTEPDSTAVDDSGDTATSPVGPPRAVVVETMYASGTWTGVAVPVLYTGHHPWRYPSLFQAKARGLPVGTAILPGLLKEARPELYTLATLGNPIAGSYTEGLTDGYDYFDEGERDGEPGDETHHFDSLYERGLTEVSNLPAGTPFFWWLHPNEAHDPYNDFAHSGACAQTVQELRLSTTCPVDSSLDTNVMREYSNDPEAAACQELATTASACEILTVDYRIDAVLDDLEARGLLAHTAVLILGDHGDALGENRRWNHYNLTEWPVTGQRAFFLLPPEGELESVIVLLVDAWRHDLPMPLLEARFADAEVLSTPVSQVDFLPTVFGLYGLPAPEGGDGVDFLSEAPAPRILTSFSMDSAEKQAGALSAAGDRHLICKNGACVLYDPQVDFNESCPLSEAPAADLQAAADAIAAETAEFSFL